MFSCVGEISSLLLLAHYVCAEPGFIYNAPAPSPEDGPPLSAHASRNRKLLPAQICGIVGAYVVTVLIWGVLLLTVGRKMRRNAETSPKSLDIELVKARPYANATPLSPLSSKSATSWFKRGFKKSTTSVNSVASSPISPDEAKSPTSFDQAIIDSAKAQRQSEMERLYAAVMDHDAKKNTYSANQQEQAQSPPRGARKLPPMINTSGEGRLVMPNYSNPTSPTSPRSPVKAIYPPNFHQPPATAPLPRAPSSPSKTLPASPRSVLSKKDRTPSMSSASSKSRLGLKNLRISGPIQKYPGENMYDEARTPLSPRFYNPPAPPSPPDMSPITPASPEADYTYEGLDKVQPLPRPAPQRTGSSYSNPPAVGSAPTSSPGKSATGGGGALPFRAYGDGAAALPSTKTTYVDRRRDQLSLQTPRTGVPATPYSPYMPFTPITPITPHLVGKRERKAIKKVEGKKVATENDIVQSPKEIFGDAW
ncbi:hypothetical protein BU16DRAFT_465355 [Lophium mytilinum]|uniref:Uncharacterized protein n=1 Tax=Lophium mytilinum TaxID=390894 RepID=A0A6A6QNK2_9PEZI|nr:hypothetical protein BU16DRAFT_465355 [Lophium mytilinum]